MLHVTNGDCAAGVLRAAGLPGEILPWRDVLHEGPVDASLSLNELSPIRAEFIASAGWAGLHDVQRDFAQRDLRLQSATSDKEVVLWFEHDLYDQLQLAQLLAWFAEHPHPNVSLVCEAEYLGMMKPERAAVLFAVRRPIAKAELDYGREAWSAFGSDDPSSIDSTPRPELRFLGPALRRHLEEFPWTTDDLSRLEREVVAALAAGPLPFGKLFAAIQRVEEPIFLGDAVLEWHLRRMEKDGLLRFEATYSKIDSLKRTNRMPRWLGGVRVDEACPWRWDPAPGKIVRVT